MRLREGIVAGLIGRASSSLIGILLTPLYLHTLGAEGIGLIGFYTALLGVLVLADQVLGIYVMRETARVWRSENDRTRDVLFTAEIIYLGASTLFVLGLSLASEIVAQSWLISEQWSKGSVETSIQLIAWTIPLQLFFNLHNYALMGLERQLEANTLLLLLAIVRGCLGVFAVYEIGPSSESYFGSQLIALLIAFAASLVAVWMRMPSGSRSARFRFRLVSESWIFGSFLIANGIMFVILTQADKIIVSALLPLKSFGYYSIASTVATLPAVAVGPLCMVLLARFARSVSSEHNHDIVQTYHLSSQFASVLVLPLWGVVFFFSSELIFMWTGSPSTADEVSFVLPMLFSGATLLSLNAVPVALSLAGGWAQYQLVANSIAIASVPLAYFTTVRFGMVGATLVWISLGLSNVTILPILLHKRVLKKELTRWYILDIGLPMITVASVACAARLLCSVSLTRGTLFVILPFLWTVFTAAAIAATPAIRFQLYDLAIAAKSRAGLRGSRK